MQLVVRSSGLHCARLSSFRRTQFKSSSLSEGQNWQISQLCSEPLETFAVLFNWHHTLYSFTAAEVWILLHSL